MNATDYIDVVKNFSHRYTAHSSLREDCYSAALLAIVKFCDEHQEPETTELRCKILTIIRRAILDEGRNQDHLTRRHRSAVKNGESEDVTFCDLDDAADVTADDGRSGTDHADQKAQLTTAIAALRKTKAGARQAEVLTLVLSGKNQTEIGKILGITHQRVSQIEKDAHSALRKVLKHD